MPLIVEKLRAIQLNSDFWTECPKVQNLQLNMEPLTSGHCVQKKKSFVVYLSRGAQNVTELRAKRN